MKKYKGPELEILLISDADIVTASDPEDIGNDIIWEQEDTMKKEYESPNMVIIMENVCVITSSGDGDDNWEPWPPMPV